jgi:hypothetical protein
MCTVQQRPVGLSPENRQALRAALYATTKARFAQQRLDARPLSSRRNARSQVSPGAPERRGVEVIPRDLERRREDRQDRGMYRLLAALLATGCVPTSYTYSPSVAHGPAPRPQGCVVEIVRSPPAKAYEEVGTLTFYNGTEPTTVEDFKRVVSKQVCEVGGDAVIATANAKGQLTTGTVIRYQPEPGR